ncbi:VCBS repeat-containing protein [Dechloromonas hortensis]|uniref:VCBS repeat-containing protein n=1 Tax=Dechloromonas hortensis TaxID=337779 RepID=UPI0012914716|nr:VCBS repeat-containing protein [Dechloromonas hortensis]
MKIASANLQMASSHVSLQQHEKRESLNMWVGQRRPNLADENSRPNRSPADTVALSDAAKSAQAAACSASESDAAVDNDPKLNLIRTMLEYLTGRRFKIFDSVDLQPRTESVALGNANTPASQATAPPPPAGYGVEYDYHESYTETEQTSFSASGSVTTADGRSISFGLQLSMQRTYHEESSVSLRLGDAARKVDPLVLNFSGNAAQLTNQRFAFDLNADGSKEQINFVGPGSGFLVFDRNSDGRINDGKELFGPTSGDGFQELAALDDDKNGWIDESDAAYQQLQVWSRNAANKDQLQSLTESGVGAISLSRIETPFQIKNYANQLLGEIRSSGVFLQEDGRAGTIQQIDLTA